MLAKVDRRGYRTKIGILITGFLGVQLLLWVMFALTTARRGSALPVELTGGVISILVGILFLAGLSRSNVGGLELFVLVASQFSGLVACFTALYYAVGTSHNFSMPLSHGDALYLAIGTLSTAGTGSVVATSQLARAIQSAQMVLDLGLVVFAVGLIIGRFVSRT